MDLQIKLLSRCPLTGPTVISCFVKGWRRIIQAPNLASPPDGTLVKGKKKYEDEGEGEEEKRVLPSHLFATRLLTIPYLSTSTHLSARLLPAICDAVIKMDF